MGDHVLVERPDVRLLADVRGHGPALLFTHPILGTHADSAWLDSAAAGCTIIAPDLRGRGASAPVRDVEQHTFTAHADDLAAILDDLDLSDAIVAGTSFGAAVATAFALRHPSRVRALVLISSAFGGTHDPMGEGDLASHIAIADRIEAEGLEAVARTNGDLAVQRWVRHDEASVVAIMRAVARYRPFDRSDDLRAVNVPALVVSGRDELHTRALSEAYAAALPHATFVDADTPVAQAFTEFIARVT